MTGKPKLPPVPVLNPRYAGAMPEDVGRALMRHKPDGSREDDAEPDQNDEPVPSGI